MTMRATTSKQRQPKRWTEDEDTVLLEEAMKQSASGNIKDWHQIASSLPGRSNKDCRKRWVNTVCGGLNKGFWSEDEDQRLLEALQKYGPKWVSIAEEVGTRSADQCAKRWQHGLDPRYKRGKWTGEEDKLLLTLVQQHGREWKYIQHHHYPNRSKNDVKNRYTIISRRHSTQASHQETQPQPENPDDDPDEEDSTSSVDENDTPSEEANISASEPEKHHWRDHQDHLGFPDDPTYNMIDDFDFTDFVESSHQQNPYDAMDFCDISSSNNLFHHFSDPSTAAGSTSTAPTGSSEGYVDAELLTSMFGSSMPGQTTICPADIEGTGRQQMTLDADSFAILQRYLKSGGGEDEQMVDSQDPSDTSSAGKGAARNRGGQLPRVVIAIEECTRDTLNYVLDVTKPIKRGKVKVEIHMS